MTQTLSGGATDNQNPNSGLVYNANGSIDNNAYTSAGTLIGNLLNSAIPGSAAQTTLAGGVSNDPGVPTNTTQTQGGTPGTQTQTVQVNTPQQVAAGITPPTLNQPTINPLTFNATAPTVGNPLQPFTPIANQIATSATPLATPPPNMAAYGMMGAQSNQAAQTPVPQPAGPEAPSGAPQQIANAPGLNEPTAGALTGSAAPMLPGGAQGALGEPVSPQAPPSPGVGQPAPSYAAGINSGKIPPLPIPGTGPAYQQQGQYDPPGGITSQEVYDENPKRTARKAYLKGEIQRLTNELQNGSPSEYVRNQIKALRGQTPNPTSDLGKIVGPGYLPPTSQYGDNGNPQGNTPAWSPDKGTAHFSSINAAKAGNALKGLSSQALKYLGKAALNIDPKEVTDARKADAMEWRLHRMGNIDAEYNAKMSDLRSLSSEYTRVEEAQVADEAALAKERRADNKVSGENAERFHKELGGLRPDDPHKIARVVQLAQMGAIPNTPESIQGFINDFDPMKEAKDAIELGKQRQDLDNSILNHQAKKQMFDYREQLQGAKVKSADLNNKIKGLQIKLGGVKVNHAETVANHKDQLDLANLQRKKSADARENLKMAIQSRNHADAMINKINDRKLNPFNLKDPDIAREDAETKAAAMAARAEANKTINNLADGKDIEDDDEEQTPPPVKAAPAAAPKPLSPQQSFKAIKALVDAGKVSKEVATAKMKAVGMDYSALEKQAGGG
jgi:hypothetical protein